MPTDRLRYEVLPQTEVRGARKELSDARVFRETDAAATNYNCHYCYPGGGR
jgi:hypothetical protein